MWTFFNKGEIIRTIGWGCGKNLFEMGGKQEMEQWFKTEGGEEGGG